MNSWQLTDFLLTRGLDATALRARVLANNVANVNTPGFKRADVSFQEELRRALAAQGGIVGAQTDPRHLPVGGSNLAEVSPRLYVDTTTSMRNDHNNVDIDVEMARVAENSLLYNSFAELMSRRFSILKYIIREGR